jgi:hypothetical protein
MRGQRHQSRLSSAADPTVNIQLRWSVQHTTVAETSSRSERLTTASLVSASAPLAAEALDVVRCARTEQRGRGAPPATCVRARAPARRAVRICTTSRRQPSREPTARHRVTLARWLSLVPRARAPLRSPRRRRRARAPARRQLGEAFALGEQLRGHRLGGRPALARELVDGVDVRYLEAERLVVVSRRASRPAPRSAAAALGAASSPR